MIADKYFFPETEIFERLYREIGIRNGLMIREIEHTFPVLDERLNGRSTTTLDLTIYYANNYYLGYLERISTIDCNFAAKSSDRRIKNIHSTLEKISNKHRYGIH
jgi:hypothetical protein